jgi:hypothetical protein
MPDRPSRRRPPGRALPRVPGRLPRLSLAVQLGAAAVLLAACSGSAKNLIPASDAGPLQSDFETVAQAAQSGNGSCVETLTAIHKTEQDLDALPSSVAANLRGTLSVGVANLSTRALALCSQVTTSTSSTTATTRATISSSSTTTSETTVTESSSTSTPTTSAAGGGTPGPGETTTTSTGEAPAPADNGAGGAPVGAGEGLIK